MESLSFLNEITGAILVCFSVSITIYLVLDELVGDGRLQRQRLKAASLNPQELRSRLSGYESQVRKREVDDALKELDTKSKRTLTNVPLQLRIRQAGLDWSVKQYYVMSLISAVTFMMLVALFVSNRNIIIASFFIGGLGFPRWLLIFLRNRRLNKFLAVLPDAVEIIIRGIKSGMPVLDCFKVVAEEAVEPVRSEFKEMVDAQQLGLPLYEVVERLYQNMPVAESNFFAITIAIQQKSGGNLSETLANLARVLRERKKLKMKISALISEAKASAFIIGFLPFFVLSAVYLMNPGYMEILWRTDSGIFLLIMSACFYITGIFTMHKMINFEF